MTASLLRTRGGISKIITGIFWLIISSPHTRRYFLVLSTELKLKRLFSAHAEVFPHIKAGRPGARPLLRTRGGISIMLIMSQMPTASSPHTRRYFQEIDMENDPEVLFSAHAEVFPWYRRQFSDMTPLLRTRGGISTRAAMYAQPCLSSPHTRRYFRGLSLNM